MKNRSWITNLGALGLALAFTTTASAAVSEWGNRSLDNMNNANVGDDPGLTPENVKDLEVTQTLSTETIVVATPIVTSGLIITGDFLGYLYIFDEQADGLLRIKAKISAGADPSQGSNALNNLSNELGNYVGIQATPFLAEVTNPTTGLEEKRLYVMPNSRDTLHCYNLDAILAVRGSLSGDDGSAFTCDGPLDGEGNTPWPLPLLAPGSNSNTMNGSAKYVPNQLIDTNSDGVVDENDERRDVIYTPTTGRDCANGEMWALDAWSGENFWAFDPVQNHVYGGSLGGVIWTTPALNGDNSIVYVTTGNCVQQPQVGEMAEALVALDAATGEVLWHHQRRLIDTADLDIGVGPSVVEVEGEDGCSVVVAADKDGCIYGHNADIDIPEVGDLGWDPLRPGQQRVLYRQCFVPGSLNGGFNASNGAVDGRLYTHTIASYPAGHVKPDDSNAFAIDACTGKVKWASSDVRGARTDSVIASGMLFQGNPFVFSPGGGADFIDQLNVVRMDNGAAAKPEHLATVTLSGQASIGGGGPAIVNGTLYVPTTEGVDIVKVVPGSNASAPIPNGNNIFLGPYPAPVAPDVPLPFVNLDDPYPLLLDSTVEENTGDEIPAPGDAL